ncbi:MAG: hypothetical protein A3C47_03930 [Omnitrophica bacterium RIFCSPHIGHO2_02_FULL_51_18]|nr:MAG: hypothetical protein A3C47_03930 [Omnitrophica bacterium RIFCSPHIGHO2_02_FULL_51_18]
MSKLIESLKASAKEFSKKEGSGDPGAPAKKSPYEMTQQQLADIYFSGPEKLKRYDEPLVIKVIEKPRLSSTLPWVISSVAMLLAAFSLFSAKRVFVDVKVIDEKHARLYSASRAPAEDENPVSTDASSESAWQIKYGDTFSMQDFIFEGAAKLQSSKDKSSLTLVNSSVAPFARANLFFRSALNLKGAKIVFYAKGGRGGENIAFSIKDSGNLSAFPKGRTYPFPASLTTDWQRAEIPIYHTEGKFDEENVASLRFDVGSKDTENKPGDTVFIRDLQVVPI